MNCPKCGAPMVGVEYAYNNPARYDGISEWFCKGDNLRIGRWSKRELANGEVEIPTWRKSSVS